MPPKSKKTSLPGNRVENLTMIFLSKRRLLRKLETPRTPTPEKKKNTQNFPHQENYPKDSIGIFSSRKTRPLKKISCVVIIFGGLLTFRGGGFVQGEYFNWFFSLEGLGGSLCCLYSLEVEFPSPGAKLSWRDDFSSRRGVNFSVSLCLPRGWDCFVVLIHPPESGEVVKATIADKLLELIS